MDVFRKHMYVYYKMCTHGYVYLCTKLFISVSAEHARYGTRFDPGPGRVRAGIQRTHFGFHTRTHMG